MLEAYWMLSAKRFTDNICMLVDREILGEHLMGWYRQSVTTVA